MRISFVVRRIDTLIHKRKLSHLLYECWNCFQNILKMKISLRVLVLKHRLTQTSIQFFLPDSLPQNPAYNLHSPFASNLNLKFYFPTLLQCAYPLVFLLTPFKLIIPLSYIGCALTNQWRVEKWLAFSSVTWLYIQTKLTVEMQLQKSNRNFIE